MVLAALAAAVVCTVVRKARAEDLPQILTGLSQMIEAMASFLPWHSLRRRLPRSTDLFAPLHISDAVYREWQLRNRPPDAHTESPGQAAPRPPQALPLSSVPVEVNNEEAQHRTP
jgi:hypothetical protein